MKLKKIMIVSAVVAGLCAIPLASAYAADDAAPASSALTDASGNAVDGNAANEKAEKGGGFMEVVFGKPGNRSIVGMLLWFALFGDGILAIYFCIDCNILIKPEKLMPQRLIDQVQAAMAEGDIVAAIEACKNTPSAMSNILLAAFTHIEDGYETIQEAVNAASDLEQEKLMQRLTWISVCSNLGPSLGLLGTVQGMILTFDQLASGPAPQPSDLAGSIGMALWTTAAGLIVSIPSITMFYALRNNANRRILRMTAVTMEFLNSLRNVEVASDETEQV